jgi:hypothetical protein
MDQPKEAAYQREYYQRHRERLRSQHREYSRIYYQRPEIRERQNARARERYRARNGAQPGGSEIRA